MVSEASGPCFHKADLDFENVNVEEDTRTIFCENLPTKEKEHLHQEAPVFCHSDGGNTAGEELPGEAALQGEVVLSTGQLQKECCTSSGEDPQQGEDEEDEGEDMKAGKQLLLAYTGPRYHGNSKGDGARPSVEGQPLPPDGDENTPVRNEEQGETESDEISYFQRVPERGSKTERTEDDQQESEEQKPDSEGEAPKSEDKEEDEEEQDEDDYDDEHKDEGEKADFEQEDKHPQWDDAAGDILDFLELRVQYLQDLMADDEEPVQKMEDFLGEDHQEAGESFAEYPSDFSSGDYINQGEGDEDSSSRCTGDQGTVGRVTDSDRWFVENEGREEWKAELVEIMSGDIVAMRCETSDSYSSGDEEPKGDLGNQLDEHHSGSRDDLLVDKERFPDVTPAEGVGMSSGSLDDSFFSSAEHQSPQISELGEDDEYEEKSNWEQEQERRRAFNEFYEDSDQLTGQEGTGKGECEG